MIAPDGDAVALAPALLTTLAAVAAAMATARDRWWIIGSAAVALHGGDAGPVADVDVVLGIGDARRVFSQLGLEPRHGAPHPDFRSRLFATWHRSALPVEYMAGFHHRTGGVWRPVAPVTRTEVLVTGGSVFVPGREELIALLADFGRPKDIARAESLGRRPL